MSSRWLELTLLPVNQSNEEKICKVKSDYDNLLLFFYFQMKHDIWSNKQKQTKFFFLKTKTLPIGQFQRWPSKPTEIYLTYILGKLKASRRAWIRTPYFCPISVATRGNLNHSGVRYSTLQSVRFLQISFIEYTPTSERDTPGKIICLSLNWVAIRSQCKYNRITIANFLRNIKRFICIVLRLQIE